MARSRITAAFAALALVGASVFAGSLVAYAAPPAPVMQPTGGWTSDPTPPQISGNVNDTSEAQTVTVRVTFEGTTSIYCTFPIAAGGDPLYFCQGVTPLAIGDHTFQAFTAFDSASTDYSPGSETTVYYVGGSQPIVIDTPVDGTITPDSTPTFTGTGPSRGTVTVTGTEQPGGTPVDLCTDPDVDVDGSWSCTATPLMSGENGSTLDYSITASAVQFGGVPNGPTAPQTLSIRPPDTPTIDYPYGAPWTTGQARPALSGTLSVDATEVEIWIEVATNSWAQYCVTPVALTDTTWTCTNPLMDLMFGVNTLGASARSESGTLGFLGNYITVDRKAAPIILTPTDDQYTNDTTPEITGEALFGGTVTVYLDGEFPACPDPVVVAGSFSCTSQVLSEGAHNLLAEVAGGSPGDQIQSEYVYFVVDTTAPAAPIVDTSGNTNNRPLITGLGEDNATVTVFIDGNPIACFEPTVADSEGNWSCSVNDPLSVGPHTIGATQTDRAGNASSATPTTTNSITVLAPPVPPTPDITTAGGPTYNGFAFIEGTLINPANTALLVRVSATSASGTNTCDWYTNTAFFGCGISLGEGLNTITAISFFDDGEPDSPGGTSNAVAITRLIVSKPTVNLTLGPASVTINGFSPQGGDVFTEFYRVDASGEGYNYDVLSTCGTGGSEGEGEGDEGEAAEFGSAQVEFAAGSFGCTFSELAPGIYNSYTNQSVEENSSPFQNDYLIIPTTPTLAATPNDDGTVTFSGWGTPGYLAYVQTADGSAVCQTGVAINGTWACTVEAPTGSYRAGQQAQSWFANTGNPNDVPDRSFLGFSAYSTVVGVVVAELPTLAVPPAPPAAVPGPWTFSFGAGGTEFEPGDSTVLTGSGLPAGAQVEAEFHSVVTVLGDTVVTPAGEFGLPVTIPEDATAGVHHFVVTITPAIGPPSTQEQAVTVKWPAKASASPTKEEVASTLALLGGDAGGSPDRDNPAAPSSLTTAIPTVGTILFSNPVVIGVAAFAGLVLLLLVALPAELLNSTISEQYPRFAKRLPRMTWAQRVTAWFERVPVVGGIGLTLLAALIFGFTDPGFGFDVVSLRVVLSCALALFVVGYLASVISGAIIRRRWGLSTVMELKPLGIILAIVGVVISRLIDFSPGFMLGLILGIALVGNTTVVQRATATLVQAGVVFVLALLGWVAYSVLSSTTEPDSFFTTLMFDTSVAITTEGLTALFVGMLPFRYLDGEVVFQYNKVLWAATYVVAALAFVTIVVPNSYGELDTPAGAWLLVVGIFAALALGIWAYFRFFARPFEEDEEEELAKEKVDA